MKVVCTRCPWGSWGLWGSLGSGRSGHLSVQCSDIRRNHILGKNKNTLLEDGVSSYK